MAPSLKDALTPPLWPSFTEEQISFLERLFPARVLGEREQLEAHIRYAGKVDLIAQMRLQVPGNEAALDLNEDEEEVLDGLAVSIAKQQQEG